MSGSSYTKTGTRKKTEILYRAAIRRNTCIQILYVNAIMFLLLLLAVHSCINFTMFSFQTISRDESDQHLLTKYKDMLGFFECPYQSPGEYSTKYCSGYCGENALITRVHRLDKSAYGWKQANRNFNKPANCSNKLEVLDCHEDLVNSTCPEPRTNLAECGGMPGSTLTKNLEGYHPLTYGRRLTSDDLYKTYLANELIIYCPVCQITSEPFKIKYKEKYTDCLVKVSTMANGWPDNYKFCKNTQEVNDTGAGNCSIIDQ